MHQTGLGLHQVVATQHLTGELFKQVAGVNIQGVMYRGSAQVVQDLLGNTIQLAVDGVPAHLPHIKSGKARAIASTGSSRAPQLPDVPTVAELGYPGFSGEGWGGVVVTKGAPNEIVVKVSSDLRKVMSDPAVQQRLLAAGLVVDNQPRDEWIAFAQDTRHLGRCRAQEQYQSRVMGASRELAERDATGEKAAIYAEIRHLGGVPMVALIFRHIATMPGGIEWAWNAIGPVWRSGRLQETAWRIAQETAMTAIASISRPALRALGVDQKGLREIRAVLDAYNRANPENMLSVLCLLRLLDGRQGRAPIVEAAWTPPRAPGQLVAMADVATLPREVVELLDQLAARSMRTGRA